MPLVRPKQGENMAKKQPETAPQAFVEMLREYAHAQQAWQRNIGGNVEPPLDKEQA